jgi:hypothetical protein
MTEIQDTKEKASSILAAVNELPRAHRDCLQFLVFHLSRVIQHEAENLVSQDLRTDAIKQH